MAQQFVISDNVAVPGDTLASSVTVSGTGGSFLDEQMPPASTDAEYALASPLEGMTGIAMLSEVDATVKTNDAADPDDTWPLKAGEIFEWHSGSLHANPVTAAITAVFITNVLAGRIRIYPIYDATP